MGVGCLGGSWVLVVEVERVLIYKREKRGSYFLYHENGPIQKELLLSLHGIHHLQYFHHISLIHFSNPRHHNMKKKNKNKTI